MVARCKRLGWEVRNDNEGDACALWSYGCALIDPKLAMQVVPLFNLEARRMIEEVRMLAKLRAYWQTIVLFVLRVRSSEVVHEAAKTEAPSASAAARA